MNTMRMAMVLPDPFGPTTSSTSPGCTGKETSSITRRPESKDLEMETVSTAAVNCSSLAELE